MDISRKVLQIGMTRAKRYANHKGEGKDYGEWDMRPKWELGDGEEAEDGEKRKKEEASRIIKGYWVKVKGQRRLSARGG